MSDESAFLKAARDRFDKIAEFERDSRDMAQEDLCFVGGEQWPENIKTRRQANDQPCLTINRLPQFTQQVIGDARQNKPGIKVSPVDDGSDVETAEVFEGLIRNIEAQSRAPQAYINALQQAVEGGFGHWRIVTEYASDDTFDQDIRIKRMRDSFSVFWDHNAKEYDKSDANHCFVSDWMDKDTFKERWPDKATTDWEQDFRSLRCKQEWFSNDRVRICEYWVKKPTQKKIGLLPSGEVMEVIEGERYVRIRVVKSHKVCRYIINGAHVLEGEQEFPSKYIPIISVYGPDQYHEDQWVPRSLVRFAKDPQRMFNYWQTTVTEKVALTPKSPWLATPDMIKGRMDEWNQANRTNASLLLYNVDPKAPALMPKRQEPASINAAEIQQSAQAIDDLKSTMGMYDASLGRQGNEQSGKAILARQREGDTASFSWIDNLSWSIQHTGKILIDMIPRVYDTARVVRVLGEDDSESLVRVNQADESGQLFDLTVGKYDVHVSVGPSYATKRAEASDSMLAFIQAYPQAATVIGDLIAKNQDWPGADDIADRLKKMLPPGVDEDVDAERPQPLPDPQAEAEAAKHEADIEGKHLDNAKKAFELMAESGELDALIGQRVQDEVMRTLAQYAA